MKNSFVKLKVFVAMSGGVDSSVTAALLKKQGCEAIGVHMKCYNLDGCGERDAEDARRAAEVLGIPFYVFDFEKEYKDKVVEYMIDGYRRGITPNPDVMCNKEIKFGLFLKKALSMGANYVATGHYARLVSRYISDGTGIVPLQRRDVPMSRPEIFASRKPSISGLRNCRTKHTEKLAPIFYLLAAKDKNKDQSYFLWTLTQKQLKYCLFPIGEYTKPEVRKLAKKFGLPNAEKKDSQGICFLGQVNLRDFLKKYIPEKKGLILDTSGRIVGEHNGVWFYTIGQRHIGIRNQELGIRGRHQFKPRYVAEKDVKANTILVAEGEDNPALYKNEINLCQVNFIDQQLTTNDSQRVLVRVRYRQPLFPAILKISHRSSVVSCKLIFEMPQKFVASGQSAVFYLPAEALALPKPSAKRRSVKEGSELELLGGGIIV